MARFSDEDRDRFEDSDYEENVRRIKRNQAAAMERDNEPEIEPEEDEDIVNDDDCDDDDCDDDFDLDDDCDDEHEF